MSNARERIHTETFKTDRGWFWQRFNSDDNVTPVLETGPFVLEAIAKKDAWFYTHRFPVWLMYGVK